MRCCSAVGTPGRWPASTSAWRAVAQRLAVDAELVGDPDDHLRLPAGLLADLEHQPHGTVTKLLGMPSGLTWLHPLRIRASINPEAVHGAAAAGHSPPAAGTASR